MLVFSWVICLTTATLCFTLTLYCFGLTHRYIYRLFGRHQMATSGKKQKPTNKNLNGPSEEPDIRVRLQVCALLTMSVMKHNRVSTRVLCPASASAGPLSTKSCLRWPRRRPWSWAVGSGKQTERNHCNASWTSHDGVSWERPAWSWPERSGIDVDTEESAACGTMDTRAWHVRLQTHLWYVVIHYLYW